MVRQFGLIGRGLSHSFSADFFNRKFDAEGIDAEYANFDLPDISLLPQLIADNPALVGLNVTSPYKREVIQFLDSLSAEVEALAAVNVIRIHRNGGKVVLEGHNTDSEGFRETLASMPPGLQAVVLGSGGASSAVCHALKKEGIPFLTVSRNPGPGQIGYDGLDKMLPSRRLIVNATPVGMYPHIDEYPDIPYHLLSEEHFCYDLVYNPAETLFMKKAAEAGARTLNGLQMLLNQARLSWEIWNQL